MFAMRTNGEAGLEDPGIIFRDKHVHTFLIEPGSEAEGKTVGDLGLRTRYGISEFGIRSQGKTTSRILPSRKLQAGEALITFMTDETARELAPLFEKKR